jgi:hypothetical protein
MTSFPPSADYILRFAFWFSLRYVGTERFFGHIITRRGVGPAPAPAAYLPVAADAALAFERISIPHACEVLAPVPNIRKPLFENVTAFNGQITARKDVSLMPDKKNAKPGQTAFR